MEQHYEVFKMMNFALKMMEFCIENVGNLQTLAGGGGFKSLQELRASGAIAA